MKSELSGIDWRAARAPQKEIKRRGWPLPFEYDLLELIGAYPDQQRQPRTSVCAKVEFKKNAWLTEGSKNGLRE